MIRIQSIKVPVSQGDQVGDKLEKKLLKALHIKKEDLLSWRIYKRSIDARRKDSIQLVYTIDATVKNEKQVLKKLKSGQALTTPVESVLKVAHGSDTLRHPPVIIGTGPAGLFAGLLLAYQGYNPILLEKGKPVDQRVADVYGFWKEGTLDIKSNVQFGEGGAGTFSDGKLTTRISDTRCRWVLNALAEHGAPEDVLYDSKPHIGTDRLREVVVNIRKSIEKHGGKVLFEHEVEKLVLKDGKVRGIKLMNSEELDADIVIGAMGHSARDLFETLYHQGIPMMSKPFSIGVRIEHPQELINRIQYGEAAVKFPVLGAADYRLSWHHPGGRGAYSFCMCPGGQVVASASERGGVVTNGMSAYGRKGKNANSALLVSVTPEDFGDKHPLAGISFQRKWEQKAFLAGGESYRAPAQRVEDFIQGKPSGNTGSVTPTYRPGVTMTSLEECLPSYVTVVLQEALKSWNHSMNGFAMEDALLTGVETRSSSPVRLLRDERHQSAIHGFYPAGEGSGHAGGIMSAAVDGIKTAEEIIRQYKPI